MKQQQQRPHLRFVLGSVPRGAHSGDDGDADADADADEFGFHPDRGESEPESGQDDASDAETPPAQTFEFGFQPKPKPQEQEQEQEQEATGDDEPPPEVYAHLADEGDVADGDEHHQVETSETPSDIDPEKEQERLEAEAIRNEPARPAEVSTAVAEMAVAGAMLLDPGRVREQTAFLEAADFSDHRLGQVFAVERRLVDRTGTCDIVLLQGELKGTGLLERLGGPVILSHLVVSVPTAANAPHYANIVKRRAQERRAKDRAEALRARLERVQEAEDPVAALQVLTAEAAELAAECEFTHSEESDPYDFAALVAEGIDQLTDPDAAPVRAKTGLPALDERIDGLPVGEPTVIAARPGVGKSALALDIVRAFARRGELVYVLSVEMNEKKVLKRLAAGEAVLDHRLFDPPPKEGPDPRSEEQIAAARVALQNIADWPVAIEDAKKSSATIERIPADVRRAEQRYGRPVSLIVIDHAQLVRAPKEVSNRGTRVDQVEHISRRTRELAKEHGCSVLLLSQLNRGAAHRDGAPRGEDLKNSSALEEDAGLILTLKRPEGPRDGSPKIMVIKNREGWVGPVALPFCGPAMTWTATDDQLTAPPLRAPMPRHGWSGGAVEAKSKPAGGLDGKGGTRPSIGEELAALVREHGPMTTEQVAGQLYNYRDKVVGLRASYITNKWHQVVQDAAAEGVHPTGEGRREQLVWSVHNL